MATNYVQKGDVIAFTAGAAHSSGDVVVIGALIGVALSDVANGAEGQAQISGVFELPKATAAVIGAGESLTWDSSAGNFDDNAATPATGDVTGAAAVAIEAAGNGATTVKVRLTGVPGTVN